MASFVRIMALFWASILVIKYVRRKKAQALRLKKWGKQTRVCPRPKDPDCGCDPICKWWKAPEIKKDRCIKKVNYFGRLCVDHQDFGGGLDKSSLFDALPIIAVVSDQLRFISPFLHMYSSGKSSLLESIVGIEYGSEFVTRKPLVLHLVKHPPKIETVVQFSHLRRRLFCDLSEIRQEIEKDIENQNIRQESENLRTTGKLSPSYVHLSNLSAELINNKIDGKPDPSCIRSYNRALEAIKKARPPNPSPIHLFIDSPDVINNLVLIDLPALTNDEGVEKMVKTYINKPNCIILAVSPAGQDLAKSGTMKLAREVDPSGQRTIGVLTGLDLMDSGTHALDVLEGRAYPLDIPWVGVASIPLHDTDMMMYLRRRREQEYFATSPHYAHLADRMGSEYLANLLSQRLESLIKATDIGSLINKGIHEMEADPKHDQTMLLLYKMAKPYF